MEKKGFTLIELLVVIAIIALLLAVIMPSLSKAKTYAQEIVCKSNIRQYAIATEIYSNENNDGMPDPWNSLYDSGSGLTFAGETQRYCRWHNPDYNLQSHPEYAGPYWPYLEATKANVCPTFARVATKYGAEHMVGNNGASSSACVGAPFEPQFSYSMNSIFRKTVDGKLVTVKRTQVKSPSQTFLWAEENMWTLSGLSKYVLNDNALCVGTSGTDTFGSFHRISNARLSIQQSERAYTSDTGTSNIIMVDGSVRVVTPEEDQQYKGEIR